jgi:hypothetical protein
MPFFLPVDYYDTRVQFVDNVSWVKGQAHGEGRVRVQPRRLGADLPRLRERRYIFGSTDGFMNYVTLGPTYVE